MLVKRKIKDDCICFSTQSVTGSESCRYQEKRNSNLDAGGEMGYLRHPGAKRRRDHGCC